MKRNGLDETMKRIRNQYYLSRDKEYTRQVNQRYGLRDRMVTQKERRVDALALRADEGRDKLRKAAGRSKYSAIRRYPNGETRLEKLQSSYSEYIAV